MRWSFIGTFFYSDSVAFAFIPWCSFSRFLVVIYHILPTGYVSVKFPTFSAYLLAQLAHSWTTIYHPNSSRTHKRTN